MVFLAEELIDAIREVPKVCKYIDIPLQHIHNMTLLRMSRPPQQHTVALLERLRGRVPGLVLRTTFISGFPQESEEEHRALVDFAKGFRFERMGAFAFSEEEGTPAAVMEGQVPRRVREKRRDELVALAQAQATAFAESRVGSVVDVLIDSEQAEGDGGGFVGRTEFEAPDCDPVVFVSCKREDEVSVGQMRRCKIVAATRTGDLEAVPV